MKIDLPKEYNFSIERLKKTPFSIEYDSVKKNYVYEIIDTGFENLCPEIYVKRSLEGYDEQKVLEFMIQRQNHKSNLWVPLEYEILCKKLLKYYEVLLDLDFIKDEKGFTLDLKVKEKFKQKINSEIAYDILLFVLAIKEVPYKSSRKGYEIGVLSIHSKNHEYLRNVCKKLNFYEPLIIPSFLRYITLDEQRLSYYLHYWYQLEEEIEDLNYKSYNQIYSFFNLLDCFGFREYNFLHVGNCNRGIVLKNPLDQSHSTYCKNPLICSIKDNKFPEIGYTKIKNYVYVWWNNKKYNHRNLLKKVLETYHGLIYENKIDTKGGKKNLLRNNSVKGVHYENKTISIVKLKDF